MAFIYNEAKGSAARPSTAQHNTAQPSPSQQDRRLVEGDGVAQEGVDAVPPCCFFSLLSEVFALAASLLLLGCVAHKSLDRGAYARE